MTHSPPVTPPAVSLDVPVPTPHGQPAGVSVVILTFNEADNITPCLESCRWCDDVHVVDSGSTDRTVEIAQAMGAKVHINAFRSFGQQRNWAIDHIPHRHAWVFHLDADERFTPELVAELQQTVAREPSVAGFYVPHKLIFMGRWLRRAGGGYPVYQMRFFHRSRMRFRDWGHGQREDSTERIGMLLNPYIHYNFSKGLEEWIEKHNRYSTLEAREQFLARSEPGVRPSAAQWANRVARRRFIKSRLWSRLPATWFARFVWVYFFRGGFLDGMAGFHYCLLMSNYELWIKLKMKEMRVTSRERVPQPLQAVFRAGHPQASRPALKGVEAGLSPGADSSRSF